ncbi:uncharacterized protein LOC126896377 [Daktulosphaira vitifoliae]|uniref:uncharacterized protein LOC126896377 n=1 Tax=Daktulosphaira vitifoliae TaxID=58002 RepID=UPI0021AA89F2|nr:uncharacterized protein LOC126896377 [Daktulosphaira vitifoliae]
MEQKDEACENMLDPCKIEYASSKKDFSSKIGYVLNNITVEPVLLLVQASSILTSLTTQNLNLQKACRVNLNYSDEICTAIEIKNTTFYKNEELEVQQLVTNMLIWQTIIQCSVPCVLVIFIGSWSDRHKKRKPFILIPIIGELIRNIGLILCVYFFYELPMEIAGLVESIPMAFSGGMSVLYLAAFSHVIDISTVKNRTLRVGLLNISFGTAWPVGAALSGIIYHKFGFYAVYGLSSILFMIGLITGFSLVNDQPKSSKNNKLIEKKQMCMLDFVDFFNVKHIKTAWNVTFKKGPNSRKAKIIMLLILFLIVDGPIQGIIAVEYMYTQLRFKWDEVDYSLFSTSVFLINITGILLTISVLTKILKMEDSLIGLIAVTCKVIGGFIFSFASTEYMFYFGAFVEMMFSASYIAPRAIISKIVPQDEIGQVSSIIVVIQTVSPVIYKTLYGIIYKLTMKIFPSFYYVFTSLLVMPAIFVYLWIYQQSKRSNNKVRL